MAKVTTIQMLEYISKRKFAQTMAEVIPAEVPYDDILLQLEQLASDGMIDYGISILRPWLTDKGNLALHGGCADLCAPSRSAGMFIRSAAGKVCFAMALLSGSSGERRGSHHSRR